MRLAVNVDHIATIREARRSHEPDPVAAAVLAELAGAEGITVHLRGDRRHIKERDVEILRRTIATRLNIEMAATSDMARIALQVRPDQVTLVPERAQELTTEGGLDVMLNANAIRDFIKLVREPGIPVSLFVDADLDQVRAAKAVGADAVEINTGPYTEASGVTRREILQRITDAARMASRHGLDVLAGHGLNYFNVRPIAAIREIVEVNIGHSIVARAALVGLDRAVRDMVALLKPGPPAA